MAETALTKGVVSTAEWINKILAFSLLLAVTLFIAKLLDVTEIEIAQLDVPIQFAWIAFVVLTVAHLYATLVFVTKCARLFFTDHGKAGTTWDSLTHDGPLFFRGMIPRHFTGNGPTVMSFADPTTWLVHGAAILFFCCLDSVGPVQSAYMVVDLACSWPDVRELDDRFSMGYCCVGIEAER
jgi:hypothetical protein